MISLDTETTGLDVHHGARPFFVTSAAEDWSVRFWDCQVNPLDRTVSPPASDLAEIQKLLDSADRIVGHNIKFDFHALQALYSGSLLWSWAKVHDTLIASHLLASNQPHNLTDLCLHYLGTDIEPLEKELEVVVQKARRFCRTHHRDWAIASSGRSDMPSAREKTWKFDTFLPSLLVECEVADLSWGTALRDYANMDSSATLALWHVLEAALHQRGLWSIYLERMKLLPVVFDMEKRGITLSPARLEELEKRFTVEALEAELTCQEIAAKHRYRLVLPKSGNNGSLDQFCFGRYLEVNGIKDKRLRVVRNDCLNLPVYKSSMKTGCPSLDKETLDAYCNRLTVGSDQSKFIHALVSKRKRDTALGYLESYRKFWLQCEDGNHRVYPSINPTGTDTLRFSMGNPNGQQVCFDGATELLTSVGWVRADEVTEDHGVAQYHWSTKEIDFVYPELQVHSFAGKMQHITTEQQIDMMLTPAHRCLLRNRQTGRLSDVRADEFKGDHQHFHAGVYAGSDSLILTDDEVIFLCAVQADGHYAKTDGVEYGVTFGLRKKRKIDRLTSCLRRIGADFSENRHASGTTQIYVGKGQHLVALAKRLMPDKCFGAWLLDCSRDVLDRFCEEIFQWDGCSTTENQYGSSLKKNSDWVQIIWTLSGSRAWVSSRLPAKDAIRDHHYVNLTKGKDYSMTTNFIRSEVPWDGPVYCVTVPTSYIVIRRNGKVSITGNSKQESVNLRYVFGPAPGREWWCLDYENIELRIPAYESGEAALIELFERPDEPPYFGSMHLLYFDVLHPDKFREHGASVKKVFADTWYQWTKNGDFAIQYGAQEATSDRAYHVQGAYQKIKSRFAKLEQLNQGCIAYANEYGYVETLPDRTVNPDHGYPLMCTRTEYGRVLPTVPLNYRVQGTAMWCTSKAMVRCADQCRQWTRDDPRGYHIAIQVHDELVFDFPKGKDHTTNLPKVRKLKHLMELSGDDIGIPLRVAMSYHPETWAKGTAIK